MKVVYVANSLEIGGANRSLVALVLEMKKRGFEVLVLVKSSGPLLAILESHSIEYMELDLRQPELKAPVRSCVTIGKMIGFLRSHKPDIIHANDHWIARAMVLPAKAMRIPLVAHVRAETQENALTWMWRRMPGPDMFVFNSRYMLQKHAEELRDCCSRSLTDFVYNPIDINEFYPSGTADTATDGSPVTVAMLANYSPTKGQDIYIRAISLLVESGTTARFKIIGYENQSLEYGKKVNSLVRDLGLQSNVEISGHVEDVACALRSIDVVVCPSRKEPFGRSAAEALASGVPVIASSVDGLPEVVADGECGILVPPEDVEALALAMRTLISDPSLRKRFGEAGRRRAREMFTSELHADRMIALYERLAT